MMSGGIAYYKGLLPEWMAPEGVVDLNPAVMKAGVEARGVVFARVSPVGGGLPGAQRAQGRA